MGGGGGANILLLDHVCLDIYSRTSTLWSPQNKDHFPPVLKLRFQCRVVSERKTTSHVWPVKTVQWVVSIIYYLTSEEILESCPRGHWTPVAVGTLVTEPRDNRNTGIIIIWRWYQTSTSNKQNHSLSFPRVTMRGQNEWKGLTWLSLRQPWDYSLNNWELDAIFKRLSLNKEIFLWL